MERGDEIQRYITRYKVHIEGGDKIQRDANVYVNADLDSVYKTRDEACVGFNVPPKPSAWYRAYIAAEEQ